MKDTLKKIIIIALISVSFIAIFLENKVLAAGLMTDNSTYAAKVEDVIFDGKKGKIAATYMVPSGKKAPMALVVMCHGFTGARNGDGDGFLRLGKILAKNGIAAITIDFPGCGADDATKNLQPQANYTINNMTDNINSAIDYMKNKFSNIDTTMLGICGHSMGGRMASIQLSNSSYRAAAIWAPANGAGASSHEFLDRGSFSFGYTQDFIREMEDPSLDPNSRISNFSGPLLIAFDSTDESGQGVISPETVNATKNAFNSSPSSEKEWIDYEDNHNLDANKSDLVKKTADLFCNCFVGHDARNSASEEEHITVEDIVYNRVPIFDVNVFSDTAGGEQVKPDSPTYQIRQVVAVWFVIIRNIVAASLVILLIYAGMRIAIATVASDRAKYKEFFIGWLKSIIILYVINYIMYAVLTLNDIAVNMFNKSTSTEVTMYETIRTRAGDLFAGIEVGFSAMLMYFTMLFIFFRFAWLYSKRLFTVLVLIIIAPFIAGKYAYDSASGKKSTAFTDWLYQFCSNVLIQTVHALLYTSIVGTALDMSSDNVTSFIIALVFLNFMLSADKIVLNMFKFKNGVQDLQKPFNVRENLVGVFYAYGAVKFAKGAVDSGIDYGKYLTKTAAIQNSKIASGVRRIGAAKDSALDKVDDVLLGKDLTSALNDPNERLKVNPNSVQQIIILRKQSRMKGEAGKIGKQTLKLKVSEYTSVFKSGYKFIKNDVVGVGSIILAVPTAVLNPGVGVGLAIKGTKNLMANAKSEELMHLSLAERGLNIITLGQYKNRLEDKRKNERTKKKIDNTVLQTIRTINIMQGIDEDFQQLEDKEKEEAKDLMEAEVLTFRNNVVHYMNNFSEFERKGFDYDLVNMTDRDRQRMANYIIDITSRQANVDESVADEMKSYVLKRLGEIEFETSKEVARQKAIDARNQKGYNEETERETNTGKFVGAIKDTIEEFVIKPKLEENEKLSRFTDDLKVLNGSKKFANEALTNQADGDEENLRLFDLKDFVDRL